MRWNRTLLSVVLSTSLWPLPSLGGDCARAVSQESELRATVAAKEYSKQIHLAREAALAIYEHGLPGASDSSIPQQIGRPPGLSIAVAVNGELVWAEGFGFADLEQCVPVVPNTKFRIGSVSKPLTAVAATLLYQEGKLMLAPFSVTCPRFLTKATL